MIVVVDLVLELRVLLFPFFHNRLKDSEFGVCNFVWFIGYVSLYNFRRANVCVCGGGGLSIRVSGVSVV